MDPAKRHLTVLCLFAALEWVANEIMLRQEIRAGLREMADGGELIRCGVRTYRYVKVSDSYHTLTLREVVKVFNANTGGLTVRQIKEVLTPLGQNPFQVERQVARLARRGYIRLRPGTSVWEANTETKTNI